MRPVLVGIAGGTASGKSTLAQKLAAGLLAEGFRVRLIGMDSYFKEVTPTVVAPISRREYDEHNHPDSFELGRLGMDIDALLTAENDDIDVIILEGLLTLWVDDIRCRLDLKVYVDAPADERLYRRIKRNMAAWGEGMDSIAIRYLDTVRFRHAEFVEPSRWHADIVLNGSYPSDLGLQLVAAWVASRVAGRGPSRC